jgi:hypothetical protein
MFDEANRELTIGKHSYKCWELQVLKVDKFLTKPGCSRLNRFLEVLTIEKPPKPGKRTSEINSHTKVGENFILSFLCNRLEIQYRTLEKMWPVFFHLIDRAEFV